MDLYAQNILDRYKNPLNRDKKLDTSLHCKQTNRSCGDTVEIDIKLENDKVIDYSFSGSGCAISMAATDMLGELVVGMTRKEVLQIKKEDIYEMLGIEISERRSTCALLSFSALQNKLGTA